MWNAPGKARHEMARDRAGRGTDAGSREARSGSCPFRSLGHLCRVTLRRIRVLCCRTYAQKVHG